MIEYLKEAVQKSDNIVFLGGAGVSTESGIPDFRSESGLYKAREEFGYSPEELLSHSFFVRSPDVFFQYYKENLIHSEARPNPAHKALAILEEMGKLRAVVTQNVDGLHQAAGSKNVLELHGSIWRNYCMDCGTRYGLEYMLSSPKAVPRCKSCGGIVRPDVVLYEEALDNDVMSAAVAAISAADMMIVGGTSLVVYPAAGLLHYFDGHTLALINRDRTSFDSHADIVIHDAIGKVLPQAVPQHG